MTRYVITAANNSGLAIVQSAFPKTITFASLTPEDGTFPTFTVAPVVYVLNADTGRIIYVDTSSTTTTQFVLAIGSSGGAPGTYNVDIALETSDAPTGQAVSVTTRRAPYYCSRYDVEDALINSGGFTTNGKLDSNRIRRFISMAYSRVNAALVRGGYTVPVDNVTIDLVSSFSAATAGDVHALTLTNELAAAYPVGSTVRIFGTKSATTVGEEFTNIIQHNSTTIVAIEFMQNDFSAAASIDATIELCTEGFLYLRDCNMSGAAEMALNGITIGQGRNQNVKTESLKSDFQLCLDLLSMGAISLNGLSRQADMIRTYQTDNPNAAGVDTVFQVGMNF